MKKLLLVLLLFLTSTVYSQWIKHDENDLRYYFKYNQFFEKNKIYQERSCKGYLKVFQRGTKMYVKLTTSEGSYVYTCISYKDKIFTCKTSDGTIIRFDVFPNYVAFFDPERELGYCLLTEK